MKEYKITLESDVLDPAFVSKAKDFEKKLENNEMTDEEIKAADDELIELFNKHDLSEEDSEELAAAKRERDLALAKKEVAEAETIVKLTEQKERFKKDFPEVVPIIDKKLVKLQKDAEKKEAEEKQVALDKLFGIAKKEIAECPYDELQAMDSGVKSAIELLNKKGRIAVVSFHSLEDRIVKNIFKTYAKSGKLDVLTKKPLVPSDREIAANPRSRSAKLRIAERKT